jgi:hypothetical protein
LRTEPSDAVRLIVHDPIPAPAIDRPTVRDARDLAARAHGVVAQTVAQLQDRSAPI